MAKRKTAETETVLVDGDPLGVNRRLYAQMGKLLDDLEAADLEERMTIPQRINALIAIGRIQIMFNTLRKGALDGGYAGSTVRRYAAAFAAPHAARPRTGNPRSADVIEFGRGGDDELDDGDAGGDD